jgi:hypothetical protein
MKTLKLIIVLGLTLILTSCGDGGLKDFKSSPSETKEKEFTRHSFNVIFPEIEEYYRPLILEMDQDLRVLGLDYSNSDPYEIYLKDVLNRRGCEYRDLIVSNPLIEEEGIEVIKEYIKEKVFLEIMILHSENRQYNLLKANEDRLKGFFEEEE